MSYRVPALFIEKESHSGHNDEMNFKVELRVLSFVIICRNVLNEKYRHGSVLYGGMMMMMMRKTYMAEVVLTGLGCYFVVEVAEAFAE